MENNGIRFGPAGNCETFRAAGYKATEQVFAFLSEWGLNAYEYQCGRGVRLSEQSAAAIRRQAEQYGVQVSLHAPILFPLLRRRRRSGRTASGIYWIVPGQ